MKGRCLMQDEGIFARIVKEELAEAPITKLLGWKFLDFDAAQRVIKVEMRSTGVRESRGLRPTHSCTKLTSDMIPQFGMVAGERVMDAASVTQRTFGWKRRLQRTKTRRSRGGASSGRNGGPLTVLQAFQLDRELLPLWLCTCNIESIDSDTSRNSHSSDPHKFSCGFKVDELGRVYRRAFTSASRICASRSTRKQPRKRLSGSEGYP
jgi:hypothetical protein